MDDTLVGVQEFLNVVRIPIRIACKTKTGWPMVISLWFLHEDGLLYSATQKSAKLVDYLKSDDRCGFEIAEERPPYCGIRGQARAKIDESRGVEILERLLIRYLGDADNDLAKRLLAKGHSEVAIVLKPIRVFSWDFSNRMTDIRVEYPLQKVCP